MGTGSKFGWERKTKPDNGGLRRLLNRNFKPCWRYYYFRALTPEDINHIVDIQFSVIDKRLKDRKLSIELTDAAKKYIADQGYSPVYGARRKRSLQKLILDRGYGILPVNFSEGDLVVAGLSKKVK